MSINVYQQRRNASTMYLSLSCRGRLTYSFVGGISLCVCWGGFCFVILKMKAMFSSIVNISMNHFEEVVFYRKQAQACYGPQHA